MSQGTEAIPDAKLNALLNVIHNVWFRKWKSLPFEKWSDDQWRQLIDEGNAIWQQGSQYQIVGDLVMAYIREFETRWKAWCDEREKEEK